MTPPTTIPLGVAADLLSGWRSRGGWDRVAEIEETEISPSGSVSIVRAWLIIRHRDTGLAAFAFHCTAPHWRFADRLALLRVGAPYQAPPPMVPLVRAVEDPPGLFVVDGSGL